MSAADSKVTHSSRQCIRIKQSEAPLWMQYFRILKERKEKKGVKSIVQGFGFVENTRVLFEMERCEI